MPGISIRARQPFPSSKTVLGSTMERSDRRLSIALGIGLAGFALVPWYRIESGFYGLGWLGKFPSGAAEAPGLVQIASHGRWSLAVIALLFA
ncbi:hypothetical protein NZA98_31770, partial [Escherichia coli]|nr:hypothetical protein [Escherichia coli]